MHTKAMKKTIILCVTMLISVSMFAQTAILSQIKDTADCRKWVESQLATMTLKQKIGQLFIHTVEPSLMQRNKTNIQKAIEEYGLGGLLFSKGRTEDQVKLTNLAQQWSKVPLLITFDGEWGLAMRLAGTPDFPKNRILGCIEDDSLIYRYGREVARQLHEIGAQVNFAPVADIDNNPDNPVINIRSFGSNPKEVARKVIAYARGLEDGGILAVCKHFPGHGNAVDDSHYGFTDVTKRWKPEELAPFRELIRSGRADMVMMAHIFNERIDPEYPATLSRVTIQDLLRGELGFDGVVITDDMYMNAIIERYSIEEAVVLAINAGVDMMIFGNNINTGFVPDRPDRIIRIIVDAVKAGKIHPERLVEANRRIERLAKSSKK